MEFYYFRYDTKQYLTLGDSTIARSLSHVKLMPPLIKLSNWKQYFIYLLIKAFLLLIYDKTTTTMTETCLGYIGNSMK